MAGKSAAEEALLRKLGELDAKAAEIERKLADPNVAADGALYGRLARELGPLQKTVSLYRRFRELEKQRADAEAMAAAEPDPELRALAAEEAERLARERDEGLERLKDALLAADPEADRDVIVEIRAGTGGDEASLFASDLFWMYRRFAESRRWKVEVLDANPTEVGGFKEIIFSVSGPGAYRALRYESGGHRVQRVPKTETQGRIHTSLATVGVLPQAEETEVEIDPQDLEIEFMRAGGPGGQHVNKTESAVRIVHVPTGIEVRCQEGRSQHKNRAEAMRILRTKLYELQKEKAERERGELRRTLIGTGERNDRIRTYNFPQNRVTDHRIDLTVHGIDRILAGELDELIDALQKHDREQRLAAL